MFNLSLCILYNHPIGHIILRDRIRRLDQSGFASWTARELMPLLGYQKYERFEDASIALGLPVKTVEISTQGTSSQRREAPKASLEMTGSFKLWLLPCGDAW